MARDRNRNQDSDALKQAKEMIDAIERIDPDLVTPRLKRALDRLHTAVNTGRDIAAASAEAAEAFEEETQLLHQACGDDVVCQTKLGSGLGGSLGTRSLRQMFDWRHQTSIVRLSIRNVLRRHTPEFICKRLRSCAEEQEEETADR